MKNNKKKCEIHDIDDFKIKKNHQKNGTYYFDIKKFADFSVDLTIFLQEQADADNIKKCLHIFLDKIKMEYEKIEVIIL